ncbi:MAG: (d)CMP kinase [Ruminiclostridium sp.]|nr:(d)CMP kinase [Ruminiclostridium sp.]
MRPGNSGLTFQTTDKAFGNNKSSTENKNGWWNLGKINIAIDGPAGAGKSTIAKYISKTLGIIYLDTGSMYRTVALKAMRSGIDTRDPEKLAELVKCIDIKITHLGSEQHVFLDGADVSKDIRTPEISIGASNVAVVPAVRLKLVELQREIADKNDVVMDGRDIGTYVLPQAGHKFFLTASLDERAKRRYRELQEKGIPGVTFEEVCKDIEYRDINDSTRAFAPLSKAEDAIEVDTTDMSIDQVIKKILSYIKLC